jgi:hypothetical protein
MDSTINLAGPNAARILFGDLLVVASAPHEDRKRATLRRKTRTRKAARDPNDFPLIVLAAIGRKQAI